MEWQTLSYSLEDVDKAGRRLIEQKQIDYEYLQALDVVNNWRAVHAFPLNTFQMYLRRKAKEIERSALIAQRIKRLSSIELKLERMPRLTLSEMQDIGGCRAVVNSVRQVKKLVAMYYDSDIKHKLIDEDDYISHPRKSGYRSHHLIYRYFSDKKSTYNDRKIEIQIRSKLQHAWATAVETVGTFTKQALKSSQGEKEWLYFFKLMGTVMAIKEGTNPVPDTPTEETELHRELKKCASALQVERRLSVYGAALQTIESKEKRMHFYILALEPDKGIVTVQGYKWSELENALKDYTTKEQAVRNQPGGEAVLVSVDSLSALRSAYPNYFLDTATFRNELKSALKKPNIN